MSSLHARMLSLSTASPLASSTDPNAGQYRHRELIIFPNSHRHATTFNLPLCHVKSATASTTRRDVSSFSVARYCSSFTH
ncbi:hypothetical protein AHAS_Ahas08G0098100 [Arachis hypogaea]